MGGLNGQNYNINQGNEEQEEPPTRHAANLQQNIVIVEGNQNSPTRLSRLAEHSPHTRNVQNHKAHRHQAGNKPYHKDVVDSSS